MKLLHTQVIGIPSSIAQAHVIVNGAGNVLGTFSLSGSSRDVQGAAQKITQVLSTLVFSSALELHQLLEQLIEETQQNNQTLRVAVVAFEQGKTVCCTYSAVVMLQRGSKIGKILSSQQELQIIEGSYTNSDTFVLSTSEQENITQEIQQKLEQKKPLVLIAREMTSLLQTLSDASLTAITFITPQENPEEAYAVAVPDEQVPIPVESDTVQVSSSPELEAAQSQHEQRQRRNPILYVQSLGISFRNLVEYYRGSLFSNDVYVRRRETKKLARIVIPIACVFLVAVVSYIVMSSQRAAQIQEAEKILAPINAQYEQIRATVSQTPLQARTQTENLIKNLETTAQKYQNQSTISQLLQARVASLKEFYNGISGQEEFPVLPTFFDLGLVQSDFIASTVKVNNQTLFFLDRGQKRVIALNLENDKKTPTMLPVGDQSEVRDVAFSATHMYLLTPAIARFRLGTTEAVAQVREVESANSAAQNMQIFANYLYVLNKQERNIFRYTIAEDGTLSNPVSWVPASTSLDFEAVRSFAIDGDVWIAMQNGEIKRMRTGREQAFTISGLKDPFSTPISIFTNEESQNLYVLEPQKNRLVILNKDGEFLREVKSSTLASTTSVVAQEDLKKAFALSGSLVFEIGL